jgi:hypothetical protein
VGPYRSVASSSLRRWGAVTTVSRVKWWRVWLLKLVLWFGVVTHSAVAKRLVDMRVIALGRWTLLPSRRDPRYLVFETNWAGADQSYIPDLAMLLTTQFNSIWNNTKGFPGPLPTTRFLAYIDTVDWGADHLWSDYRADASTQTVVTALCLEPKLKRFVEQTRGATPEEFVASWRQFTTKVQGLL